MDRTGTSTALRRYGVALLATVIVLLAAAAPGTPTPQAMATATLPAQGVYEGCAPGTSAETLAPCVDRLQEIAGAGFTIVLNYSAFYGAPEQIRAYAEAARTRGIRLIWPLHHPTLRRQTDVSLTFRGMAAACGCSSPQQLVPYMVDVVKTLPATWLYYVGDEVAASEHDAMKAVSELVRAADPTRDRLVVQYGTGSELAPFSDAADVLAGDYYPLWPDGGSAQDVGVAAQGVQRVADGAGKPMAMVLQAFSWGPYYRPIAPRWPTAAEYTTMRDVTLAHSRPRFILWWAYYVVKREPEAERHWDELVAGAMAPWSAPAMPALATAAVTTSDAQRPRAPRVVTVRTLSATLRGRVATVRFALSAPSRVRIGVRCGGRRVGTRRTAGKVVVRRVRVWIKRHRGACRATLAPPGGHPRTVWARASRDRFAAAVR